MDVPEWFDAQAPVVEAVVALLAPHAEAVLHDVGTDRVVALWNPSPGRAVGEPSLLGDDLGGARGVLGPYARTDRDGRSWTSVSVAVADGRGLLCLNVDRTTLDDAARILSAFAAPVAPPPAVLFEKDWRSEVDAVVGTACRRAGKTTTTLSAAERHDVLRDLEHAGVFAIRHAAGHVTRVLGISRATLYGQLKRIRAQGEHR